MEHRHAAALVALALGIASLGYAAAQGDVRVGLFLVIPFVYGTGGWAALGFLLLVAAAAIGVLGAARRPPRNRDVDGTAAHPPEARAVERRSGGVVLLGPIPIVWGSDRRILPWMIAAGAGLLLLAWWLTSGRR